MANIDQYSGMLQEIYAERGQLVFAQSSVAISSGSTNTRITIYPYAGPFIPKGARVLVKPRFTNNTIAVTLEDDLDTADTTIVTESFVPSFDIPAKTNIYFNNFDLVSFANKRFYTKSFQIFETGNSHGNDLLLDPSAPSQFTINSGVTLTDSTAYANNFASSFSVMNVPSFKPVLERIIYTTSSDGGTNEDWTLSVWKQSINKNSNTAPTINIIDSQEFIAQNDSNYVHYVENFVADRLTEDSAIILSFKKSGSSQVSSTKHCGQITLIFSYYDA